MRYENANPNFAAGRGWMGGGWRLAIIIGLRPLSLNVPKLNIKSIESLLTYRVLQMSKLYHQKQKGTNFSSVASSIPKYQ